MERHPPEHRGADVAERSFTVDLADHGELTIPYVEITGAVPGPIVTVIAGIHGTEYSSIATARRLIAEADPAQVRGTIRVAPVINLPAFYARTPFVVPHDGKNLNRSFPGDPAGTAAERIAAAVVTHLLSGSDFFFDLHCGDLPEALEPFAMYDDSPVADIAREMALAYGFRHVVRQARSGRTVGGSTSAQAADMGIPGITAESGECGILDPQAVDLHFRGLVNALRHIGSVTGDVEQFDAPVEHDSWLWLTTPAPGWWEAAVDTGETVAEGDLLGRVSPLIGGEAHEIRAPKAGVPLFVTSSPAVKADGLLLGLALV
ncbi:M14 family metallopeptidase [Microbacterium sediminis]|uniref:M14 family metallopeptidase n=1 Tax=Microbacterium sediminis TaxID=904291 RepID=UPI0013905D59|nr:M14 family metallopeptidase [Microbacterium sediminis]